jgi:hypothetical protein
MVGRVQGGGGGGGGGVKFKCDLNNPSTQAG